MKRSTRLNFFIKAAILAVIVFCVISIIRLRSDLRELQRDEEALRAQKIAYEEEIEKLKSDLAADMDDDYIMRIAREKLNYYLPDEIIFFNDR